MARGGARTGAGRPRGSKSHEYQTILASKAPVAIARLVELATKEEPNMQALKMLIDRVVPQLKPVSPPVTFSLEGSSTADYAQSIIRATSEGKLSPSVTIELLNALASCQKIIEANELENRLIKLEANNEF